MIHCMSSLENKTIEIDGSERQDVSGRTLRGDEHVLYEDCGSGVVAMHVFQSSLKYIHKWNFTVLNYIPIK